LTHTARPHAGPRGIGAIASLVSGSFRRRLLLGVLLLNLLVAVFAGLALYQSHRAAEDDAVVATQNLAKLLAHDLTGSLDKVDLAVQSIVDETRRELATGGMNARAINDFIDRVAARVPEADGLRILDRDGAIAYGSRVTPSAQLSAANREFFIRLRDNPKSDVVVSEPILGQISGKWSIVVARRIDLPNGGFGGVAYAVILLETLQKRFAELDLGSGGVVSLRDLQLGTVVRHPEPATMETAIGNRTHSKEWPAKLRDNPITGTYFAVGLDGLRRALTYQRVDHYPLFVIVGLLPDDYLAAWRQDARRTAVLLAIFALVTILFARWMRDAWDSVTERKRAQQLLENAYAMERSMRAEAERVGQLKDEFVANLSHELRTPISSIVLWAELLMRRHPGPPGLVDGLRLIERNGRRQAQMIDDLLDMQRVVSGAVRLDCKPVSLVSLVADVVATISPMADARSITVATAFGDADACRVSGDPARIQQIVLNVLNNAVNYTPEGGRIDVVVERADARVDVRVKDTGVGIDPVLLPQVFDRFRPAAPSHARRAGGLGLGLAIAKHLVELHGGSITAQSAGRDLGSTFTISFPAMSLAQPATTADDRGVDLSAGGMPQPT
jgi:signal transduction histidine kinase